MRLPVDHLLGQRMKAPLMKSVNGIGILNLIREHGPISRADLAKLSRLSKPTVSSLADSLLRSELIMEEGPGPSGARGGKKPTLIRFNSHSGALVAAEIGATSLRLALTDLEGAILYEHSLPTEVEGGAGHVLARLEQGIRELTNRRVRRSKVRAISIAASGRVDARRGLVLETGNVFNWSNVPVRETLEPVFKVPVFVDNNVNMAALGELHHGAAQGQQNFVLMRLDTGIGCGVVLGGKLYHGSRWAAGEIAHLVLDECHASEDWGTRGYLESMVGEDRTAAGVLEAAAHSARLAELCRAGDPVEALLTAAGEGDPVAAIIRRRLICHLGLATAAISAAYDPALIVLQGRLFPSLFESINALAEKTIPWGVKVSLSALGDEAVLLGTVIAARSRAYERIAREINA